MGIYRVSSAITILVFILLTASCRQDRPTSHASFNASDGAGSGAGAAGRIDTIFNPKPFWTPGREWTIDPVPIGVIGDDESESAEQLTFVFDAAFLGDDKIAIRNGNDPEIRVFDSLGKFVRMIGRRGDGPGEFDEDIHFTGSDSVLVVWDGGHFRTTWFSPEGQVLRDTWSGRATERSVGA